MQPSITILRLDRLELHFHGDDGSVFASLANLKEIIAMNNAQLLEALRGFDNTITEAGTKIAEGSNEVTAELRDLRTKIGEGATTAEVDAALAGLGTKVQAISTAAAALADLSPPLPTDPGQPEPNPNPEG